MILKAVLWVIASYLIGSIPFGLLVSKGLFKQDLRKLGSGNIGATNVMRNFGVKPFVAVMVMDMAKGIAAVKIGSGIGLNPQVALLSGLAAIIGHNWSLYLKFKGGKGVATSGGVIIAAYPVAVSLAVVGVFVIMVLATRIMSVASISAALAFPISAAIVFSGKLDNYWPHLAVAMVALLFALYKHRENIARLVRGEEPKIKLRRTAAAT
ncbi:MAG: acyl-phosphate glycerol 3-phosphate acyltransferase [Candidatus Solincola sediminis]|uniref:Glycerol-3-phosphate acyltransferase n=1 Tax=Candidatus Solincola sediminis TaxID=1797199 RepID=A0A1F2WU80_9ACTN|nr:MAG: acyl-phosphate glycerol 3-phosphate acyltransferase [Candidatus Solincola sediminis]